MKTYKITLFGVKETSKIIATYLFQQGIKLDLIVSIDPSIAKKNIIADYTDLASTANDIGADYYVANNYSLESLPDDFFIKNKFEIGIAYGWQRLIPEVILSKFQKGIFGFHASPELLPHGRGRSPLNWGIILGKTIMYNHLFKYSHHADEGAIFSVTPFAINPHDSILTRTYAKHRSLR